MRDVKFYIMIIFVIIYIFFNCINLVASFNCYQCTSIKQNKACEDPLNHPHEINASYCQPGMLWSPVINDAMPEFVSTIINTISTAVSSFSTPKDIKMLCIKAKVEDVKKGNIVLRLCTYVDNKKIDANDPEKQQAIIAKEACTGLPIADRKVLSCNVCDTNGCNTAPCGKTKWVSLISIFVLTSACLKL